MFLDGWPESCTAFFLFMDISIRIFWENLVVDKMMLPAEEETVRKIQCKQKCQALCPAFLLYDNWGLGM